MTRSATYYDCEICGHFHPWNWNADCRDDKNRFSYDDLDKRHGPDNYEIKTMEERIAEGKP